MPDDELLRAIEFETNKNAQQQQQQQQQQKKKKESEVRGSSASLTSSEPGTQTQPTNKVSLSNRLSARFSTSRPKKSSSHQGFNFLRSKAASSTSQSNSTDSAATDRRDFQEGNGGYFLHEEEDFFDADHVINSIDFPARDG